MQDLPDQPGAAKAARSRNVADEGAVVETVEAELRYERADGGADAGDLAALVPGDDQELLGTFFGGWPIRQCPFRQPEADDFLSHFRRAGETAR